MSKNQKAKLPVTHEDQEWVERSLSFLAEILGKERLLSAITVEPTKVFFDRDFEGSEADAHFILERCQTLMEVKKTSVTLEFFSHGNHYREDGALLSTPADIFGAHEGAAGTFQKMADKTIVRLERGQLKHPERMIATLSHELAHQKLLGEQRILKNDEPLTDLTAIALGFGIFIGNAHFQFTSGIRNGQGWQMNAQGYLPEQVIAYAMASLSLKKKEQDTSYTEHLNKSMAQYVYTRGHLRVARPWQEGQPPQ